MRSGFVPVVGRPNVGKSTLVSAMVGSKVAITSSRPQTTADAIRGVVNGPGQEPEYQIVLIDTPGSTSPRNEARDQAELDGLRHPRRGRRRPFPDRCDSGRWARGSSNRRASRQSRAEVIVVVSKLDIGRRGQVVEQLTRAVGLRRLCAGVGDRRLGRHRAGDRRRVGLPEGPAYYHRESQQTSPRAS